MPMLQEDIKRHYEAEWKTVADKAASGGDLRYSSPIEDAVVFPIYEQLAADLKIKVNGGRVLDIGCGSGRWSRFFLNSFKPARLLGIDFTQASVDMLNEHVKAPEGVQVDFKHGDITKELDLGERFDLINIANVLFHIPEDELFARALENLASHLAPGGRVVTTEYLPRRAARTEWMFVRSRYEFEKSVKAAGMRIVDIRAFSIFTNDPFGIDGPDERRSFFAQTRAREKVLFSSGLSAQTHKFMIEYLATIEQGILDFCKERIAQIDMPSQKLVVLGAA